MPDYVPIPKPTWFVMVITPLDKNDRIHEGGFRAHLKRMVEAGLGIYVGSGGSGEGHALTLEEWQRRPITVRAYERFAYLLHEQL